MYAELFYTEIDADAVCFTSIMSAYISIWICCSNSSTCLVTRDAAKLFANSRICAYQMNAALQQPNEHVCSRFHAVEYIALSAKTERSESEQRGGRRRWGGRGEKEPTFCAHYTREVWIFYGVFICIFSVPSFAIFTIFVWILLSCCGLCRMWCCCRRRRHRHHRFSFEANRFRYLFSFLCNKIFCAVSGTLLTLQHINKTNIYILLSLCLCVRTVKWKKRTHGITAKELITIKCHSI